MTYQKPRYSPQRTKAEQEYYKLIAAQVRQIRETATNKQPVSPAERKSHAKAQ